MKKSEYENGKLEYESIETLEVAVKFFNGNHAKLSVFFGDYLKALEQAMRDFELFNSEKGSGSELALSVLDLKNGDFAYSFKILNMGQNVDPHFTVVKRGPHVLEFVKNSGKTLAKFGLKNLVKKQNVLTLRSFDKNAGGIFSFYIADYIKINELSE